MSPLITAAERVVCALAPLKEGVRRSHASVGLPKVERSLQVIGRRVRTISLREAARRSALAADPLLATGHRLSFSGGSTG